jgi:hypothetical protein
MRPGLPGFTRRLPPAKQSAPASQDTGCTERSVAERGKLGGSALPRAEGGCPKPSLAAGHTLCWVYPALEILARIHAAKSASPIFPAASRSKVAIQSRSSAANA